jgi:hypothetical protein
MIIYALCGGLVAATLTNAYFYCAYGEKPDDIKVYHSTSAVYMLQSICLLTAAGLLAGTIYWA